MRDIAENLGVAKSICCTPNKKKCTDLRNAKKPERPHKPLHWMSVAFFSPWRKPLVKVYNPEIYVYPTLLRSWPCLFVLASVIFYSICENQGAAIIQETHKTSRRLKMSGLCGFITGDKPGGRIAVYCLDEIDFHLELRRCVLRRYCLLTTKLWL